MDDLRRRSTMQLASDPYGNMRSGIPMALPSTVKKPSHNGRMSMAGPALRAPYPIPSTNPRHSMMRSQNMNPMLQSASKSKFGRTPLNSSTRRGSMWVGGSQGAVQPGSQTMMTKDPRPLRDRQFQSRMRQDVYGWLVSSGYEITPSAFQSITGSEFRNIFQYLVNRLDPCWPFDMEKKLDEQFLPPLKALRYPYVGQLDCKWLAAPASMHSWPALLGMLHWLVQIDKARQQYENSNDPTLQNPDLVPEEFDDINHHQALAWGHYLDAYEVFFEGSDVFPEQERILEERYARKDEKVVADLERERQLLNEAEAEYERLLKSPEPIIQLQEDRAGLKRDMAKSEKCIRGWESRKRKVIDSIHHEKAAIAAAAEQLERLQAEERRLTDIVKEQNLTPEEVVRMNSEHESLSRDVETLKHKMAETNEIVVKLEVSLTKKVSDAEEALDMYTNLLSTLGLFPPLPPPLEMIDLTLELNPAVSNPQNLLIGADIRKVIKPTLSQVAEMKRKERADVESERIKVDNDLDQLNQEYENVEEEVIEVMNKAAALNDQADELREAAQQEAMVSNAEASRLERELGQARTAAMANGVGVKSRLQGLEIAYREQIDKVARLKDDTARAIIKNSSDIVIFREEVTKHLQYLREFAEAN